jgi:cell division protein FtsI/penicillin-binding protein 2
VYPGGRLAASVIGFIAYQGDQLTGQYGIERFYNDVLSRTEENLYINFFAELFSNIQASLFDRDQAEEGDVVLTIEPNVQAYLESELESVMKEWHSDQTGGIIIDPKTGNILAMAVNPNFDLNHFNKVENPRLYGNPMVEGVYEMGSIMKPLTMAAGIDAGVVNSASTYNDSGTITLNKKTISNYDGRGRGPGTTMQEVLNQSLNTGVAYVVSKLGNERFSDYMLKKYKIGEETGIDLPGEVQGLVGNLNSKRDVEYATASFGQGIAISPINMVQALSVLANGGYVINPHVVSEIRYSGGEVRKITPNPPEQVIKKETSEEITRMLVYVVDHALLGGSVKVPEYSIAAKTGTAQIARPRELGGGYYEDRYMHTFFGYFPAYDPKFLVFFYTYYPKNAEFASHTLTYPFIRTAKFLLNYYNVPPDRDPNGKRLTNIE